MVGHDSPIFLFLAKSKGEWRRGKKETYHQYPFAAEAGSNNILSETFLDLVVASGTPSCKYELGPSFIPVGKLIDELQKNLPNVLALGIEG